MKKAFMAILAFFALLTIIAVVGVEAQPSGKILTIISMPSQPSSSGGYPAINFLPQEGNANSGIVFSIDRDGENFSSTDGQDAGGGELNVNFFTIGISVDNGSIYRVTDSSWLNRTVQQLDSYSSGKFLITDYHVTDFYKVTFSSLSAGEHQVTVYLGNSDTNGNFWVYIYASSSFVVDSQATPTPSPSPSPIMTAISPSLTPTPSPTLQPTLEPTQRASPTPADDRGVSDAGVYVLIAIVLAIVVASALLTFRKRKKLLKLRKQ